MRELRDMRSNLVPARSLYHAPVTVSDGRSRRGRRWAIGAALFAVLGLLLLVAPRMVESRVHDALVERAARRGASLTLGVRFSWLCRVSLIDVRLVQSREVTAEAHRIEIGWRPALRRERWIRSVRLERIALRVDSWRLDVGDSTWDVKEIGRQSVMLAERGTAGRLDLDLPVGGAIDATFTALDLSRLTHVTRNGEPLVDPGRCWGHVQIAPRTNGTYAVRALVSTLGARVVSLSRDEGEAASFAAPVDADFSLDADVDPSGRVDVACFRTRTSGVEASGSGFASWGDGDVLFDVRLDVPRFELAPILAAAGLDLPKGATNGAAPALSDDLGSAALAMSVSGHLLDPSSIQVEEQLAFTPPKSPVPALEALRGPFAHTVRQTDGSECRIELRDGDPGFVKLEDVPPLFVRTLTIAEDAGFWNHRGVDLKEIPVAFATNWVRGSRARGASTITQQLAKNLFLSGEKAYSRKLQELALTLLLESTLPKRRILEIYLNIIEWGPNTYGLRAAARRSFGKEPAELTIKEMVYLVSLIPSPIKYQTSFEKGAVTSRFNVLLVNLLAKLRSVDAIGDDEYAAALEEPLAFQR